VNDCAVDPDSEALVVFTSGSSGIPKGVRHSHRSLLSGLRNMMLGGALSGCTRPKVGLAQSKPEPPCALVLAPLAYIAGYSAFLMSISGGGRIVLARGEPEDRIIELLELEGAQSITGASPELLRRWVRRPDAATRLRALRRLQLHGESLRRTLVEEIQTLLPEVQLLTGYGLTETSGSIATSAVSWVLDTPGCCGPLLPSVDLRIVGPPRPAKWATCRCAATC
jgi:acyl-CoA synthetase (AMP-forming)/AMP-acid ligase II